MGTLYSRMSELVIRLQTCRDGDWGRRRQGCRDWDRWGALEGSRCQAMIGNESGLCTVMPYSTARTLQFFLAGVAGLREAKGQLEAE